MHSQDGPSDSAHLRAVAAILVPENYSSVELGADLALLRLASPARLGPAVRPVCLPRATHRFAPGTACWATGWGDVQEAGEWAELPPASRSEARGGSVPYVRNFPAGPLENSTPILILSVFRAWGL